MDATHIYSFFHRQLRRNVRLARIHKFAKDVPTVESFLNSYLLTFASESIEEGIM